MSRILGVDLGTRRIGLAVSDRSGMLASPLDGLERVGDEVADHDAILGAAREAGADRIVVGLPRSLSGRMGPAARAVRAEVERLTLRARECAAPVEIECTDERFTTVVAHRKLAAAGHRSRARRSRVDSAAAAEILQSYLDGAR